VNERSALRPFEHYQQSLRLLAVAESAGTDPTIQTVAALAGIGHALLAAAPRRARKRPADPGRHTSTRDRWLFGDTHQEGRMDAEELMLPPTPAEIWRRCSNPLTKRPAAFGWRGARGFT
jgi:hypothetical protein